MQRRTENRDTRPGHPRAWDPADVDADVAAAVGRMLDDVLRERLAEAARLDAVFAHDVARRVAHFTLHGGKRRRSQFLWWGLRACGGGADPARAGAALTVAAAVELIQTCALVHDDVMDASALRRGRPALHADFAAQYAGAALPDDGTAFGAAAAVLAGDLALAWADDTVAAAPIDPALVGAVQEVWRSMRAEMVAGQYLDIHGQMTGHPSVPRVMRAARLKSALYSVERPLALGAALAGADQRTAHALSSVGRCAGLAFQLRDDLLGAFGDPRHTGKPADDIQSGKGTSLIALARAYARAGGDTSAVALLDRRLRPARDLTADELERVRALLVTTGARQAVEHRIDRLTAHGMRHLAAAGLRPHARERLRELVRAVAGLPDGDAGRPEAPGGDDAGGAQTHRSGANRSPGTERAGAEHTAHGPGATGPAAPRRTGAGSADSRTGADAEEGRSSGAAGPGRPKGACA